MNMIECIAHFAPFLTALFGLIVVVSMGLLFGAMAAVFTFLAIFALPFVFVIGFMFYTTYN